MNEKFKNYLVKGNLSNKTITSYVWTVNYFNNTFEIINKENLLAYKGYLMEYFKPKTVNLIADKPNKRYGEKIASSTQRRPDGKTVKVSANKTDPTRTVKKYGVRGNVWQYSPGYNKSTKDKYAYKHPAIFPEQLVKDHILTWSNPGDIVFDPFLGSGTTAKMALLNGRNYIGIDISEEYCEIAKKRVSDLQQKLFIV